MSRGFLIIIFACVVAVSIFADAAATEHPGPMDATELQSFLDPIFRQQMDQLHIPGAVFVLVQNGRILLAKGYGYSDLSNKSPVSPDKTLFRAGSVSKLVTATLVMQQIQSGRLALDDDVNTYLKSFHLKANYPASVTLRNLLTHTAGFDEMSVGSRARTRSEMKKLGEYLALHEPERIQAPGQVFSYSNYGFSLAGYLAQEAAGVPFLQLAQQNIFQPLGMKRTSFQLEPSLIHELATGYEYRDGHYVSVPPDYANTVPASGLVSCGADMARFMLAHLQNGQYQDVRILSEQSSREMHKRQFTHHPSLSGVCYGFFERFTNGERAIWHDGDTGAFSSFLLLLPERNIGYFISFNSRKGGIAREEITRKFFDHYFPKAKQEAAAHLSISQKELSRLAGTYRFNRYSHTSFEKLGVLAGIIPEIKVTADNNRLRWLDFQWVPVGRNLFEREDSAGYAFFREDANGEVSYLFFGASLPRAYERIAWYGTALFQRILVAVASVLFLSGLLIWTILLVRERHTTSTRAMRTAGWLVPLNCFLSLTFLIGLIVFLLYSANSISYGISPVLKVLLLLPPFLVMLSAVKIIFTALAWKGRYWAFGRRLYYSFLTLTDLAFVAFLFYWILVFPN